MTEEKVILVDEQDNPIGLMNKMEAHEKAQLHRAFSVFIVNQKQEVMLQRRALSKYHTPGLWTNTCCSHQREHENSIEAGKRRLKEEMGFETDLTFLFKTSYKLPFSNGLTEHELDHIMVGHYEANPIINKKEVEEWKWMTIEEIEKDTETNPRYYTDWFLVIFPLFCKALKQ